MAWLSTADVKIEERAVYRWRYQYAVVTAESGDPQKPGFADLFDLSDTSVVNAGVAVGDEVVRRIRVNIIDDRYPGLTKSAAVTQLDTLRNNSEYGAGGYDVVGQRYLVDPAGWSKWIKVQDLDAFGSPP